jgi:flagellar M-ring protein FliF
VLRDMRRAEEQALAQSRLDTVVDDVDMPQTALLEGAAPDGQAALPAPVEELTGAEKRLHEVRQMARNNPVAVARILRSWVNGSASD